MPVHNNSPESSDVVVPLLRMMTPLSPTFPVSAERNTIAPLVNLLPNSETIFKIRSEQLRHFQFQ